MKRLIQDTVSRARGGLCFLFVLALGGCFAVTPTSERPPRPTLLNPRWDQEAFEEHLEFLGEAFEEGSSPASQPVSDYVSAIMHEAWIQPAVESRYQLWQAPGRPLGYVGYQGGKHPPVAREAVLVCADLTGAATAPEAAALLEVARLYGLASQYTLMPERTVIFALWPHVAGQQDPIAGLRSYLRQPTWRLDEVQAVIYVGLSARHRPEVRALLAEQGIALYRISAETAAGQEEGTEAASGDETLRAALLRAMRMAQRTHERLRAATLTSGKMMPALGDTIRVPAQQRQ